MFPDLRRDWPSHEGWTYWLNTQAHAYRLDAGRVQSILLG